LLFCTLKFSEICRRKRGALGRTRTCDLLCS
jgi:hypothetical protein